MERWHLFPAGKVHPNFAPVTYLTFNDKGLILDINLTGVNFLQRNRDTLLRKPFVTFLVSDYHMIFHDHLKRLFGTENISACILTLFLVKIALSQL